MLWWIKQKKILERKTLLKRKKIHRKFEKHNCTVGRVKRFWAVNVLLYEQKYFSFFLFSNKRVRKPVLLCYNDYFIFIWLYTLKKKSLVKKLKIEVIVVYIFNKRSREANKIFKKTWNEESFKSKCIHFNM